MKVQFIKARPDLDPCSIDAVRYNGTANYPWEALSLNGTRILADAPNWVQVIGRSPDGSMAVCSLTNEALSFRLRSNRWLVRIAYVKDTPVELWRILTHSEFMKKFQHCLTV
jgi:hypothetical protein